MEGSSLQQKIDELNKTAWEIRVSDSTRSSQLSKEAIDLSEKINYPRGLAEGYRTYGFNLTRFSKNQEALVYLEKSLSLFRELGDLAGEGTVYGYQGIAQRSLGNYPESLDLLFKFSEITMRTGNKEAQAASYYHLGTTYKYLGDNDRALTYLLKCLSLAREIGSWIFESGSMKLLGQIYMETGDYQNAIDFSSRSLHINRETGDKWGEAGCLDTIGTCYARMKNFAQAKDYFNQALDISKSIQDKKGAGNALLHLGNLYQETGDWEQAHLHALGSLEIRKEIKDRKGEAEVLLFLGQSSFPNRETADTKPERSRDYLAKALALATEIQANDLKAKIHWAYYENYKLSGDFPEALSHLETYMVLAGEIHSEAIREKIQKLEITLKAEKLKEEAESYKARNLELAALYEEIRAQKSQAEEQKKIAEEALAELRATQAQLIQSEKMASLGELTAGIAHEIQNPLNFVNNFSEVNKELTEELESELKSGNSASAIDIARDIRENSDKINHHGKRAESIVKGMLQHSRTSSGQKEPTDINALCDEYLRLAYHGLRAKDKSFNARFETHFDPDLPPVNVVPQDIGRVILNLVNNAFYAVSEKKIKSTEPYDPTVILTTRKLPGKIEITVEDNGPGIPDKIKDKIFQPFFTTKPTGQGTGLGLSLAYDIVTIMHGGEISLESRHGTKADASGLTKTGTTFSIKIPTSTK